MVDSVAIFPPGFRLTDDTTGAALSGAVVRFYDAGTTTPKIVYADKDLTTALGTSVTCDSLGYPTSNGTTRTGVFTGTADYKIRIETSTGVEIVTHDNWPGAVVSSAAGSSAAVTATRPVVVKSLNYTIIQPDQNKIFAGVCSSADVVFTGPSAVTVGDGWAVTIQHAGSANQCVISTVSSQTISHGSKSFGTSYTLSVPGETVTLVSDGGNWRIAEHTAGFFKPGQGIITIADRLATPPGSPGQGAAYIVTAGPTGAWSTYALHDIAYYTGAGWINITPPTDSGWTAYVQDENRNYQFKDSAWVPDYATTGAFGIVWLADAAAMEAQASNRTVTLDVQHRHPGHPKFWAYITVAAGVPTLSTSYNVASITDTGVGQVTVTIDVDFTNAQWACLISKEGQDGSGELYATTKAAGSVVINHQVSGSGFDDPVAWSVMGLGDQV